MNYIVTLRRVVAERRATQFIRWNSTIKQRTVAVSDQCSKHVILSSSKTKENNYYCSVLFCSVRVQQTA